MTNKKLGVALVVIFAIAIGGYVFPKVQSVVVGGNPGSTFTNVARFLGGAQFENSYSTSTTATTYTLTANDIAPGGVLLDTVVMTPNVGALTVTLPASSTLPHLLPKAGMRAEQCWYNASTTAGITITFAAGTGIDLETASSSPTDLTVLADEFACLKFVRKPATATAFDFGVLLTEYTNGD